MHVIRRSRQKTVNRRSENRQVRILFDKSLGFFDWLTITHSTKHCRNIDAEVSLHQHPNAIEVVIFQARGYLEINGQHYDFEAGDAVLLDETDMHGAAHLVAHDCICILAGKGRPRKKNYSGSGE